MELRELIEHWGLTEAEAATAGITEVANAHKLHPSFPARRAAVLPYYTASAAGLVVGGHPFGRIRFLDENSGPRSFIEQKAQRYGQPKDSGVQIYLYPGLDWERIMADPNCPVIITEGEAKAIVGCRLLPTIGLGGVYNFTDHAGLHLVLEAFQWLNRPLYIVFDSDAMYNSNILAAESRLVDELYTKRRAKAYIVRIPQEGDKKVGLDDYVKAHGVDKLRELLERGESLRFRDSKILELNQYITYVEYERLVYDRIRRLWLPKDALITGGNYSSIKFDVFNNKGVRTQKPVAKEWLTHPLASRVDEALYRPGEPYFTKGEHGRCALNLWEPLPLIPGDVQPFLDLTQHLFQNLAPELRDLPLKIIAYKAQNPQVKIPLALVLIGEQGGGKSLWADLVRLAFGPYGEDITPTDLKNQFQSWLEKTLVVRVNEVTQAILRDAGETIKALISDMRRPMNEKYRPIRSINSYTFYIFTANEKGAGAFSWDDRRMVVLDCAASREWEFYERIHEWMKAGGPEHLYNYLVTLDLKGWRPPQRAPMTPEKYMAYTESLTHVQSLAEVMRTADHSVVKSWLDSASDWAKSAEVSSNLAMAALGQATLQNLPNYQIRPWYTADELVNLFPAIAAQLMASKASTPSPGKMSRELRNSGIRYLINKDDPRGCFRHEGRVKQYLVVAEFDRWSKPITQAEFDHYMTQWPRYGG